MRESVRERESKREREREREREIWKAFCIRCREFSDLGRRVKFRKSDFARKKNLKSKFSNLEVFLKTFAGEVTKKRIERSNSPAVVLTSFSLILKSAF